MSIGRYMYKIIAVVLLHLMLSMAANASSYHWSSAVPTQIQIVPDGLVVSGPFKVTDVNCTDAITTPGIYLPKTDDNFEAKLSLALTAFAAGKELKTLLYNNESSDCIRISAGGYVPKAHPYYWIVK